MAQATPFPHPLELVRLLMGVCDTRTTEASIAKALDGRLRQGHITRPEMHIFAQSGLIKPIIAAIDSHSTNPPIAIKTFTSVDTLLANTLAAGLNQYLDIVAITDVKWLTRDDVLSNFPSGTFHDIIHHLSEQLAAIIGPPTLLSLIRSEESAVKEVLTHLRQHDRVWCQSVSELRDYDHPIKSGRWQRGKQLPSLSTISKLDGDLGLSNEKQHLSRNYKCLLIMARAIDALKKIPVSWQFLRATLEKPTELSHFQIAIRVLQDAQLDQIGANQSLLAIVQRGLSLPVRHEKFAKKGLRVVIDEVKDYLENHPRYSSMRYWLDWHEGRWHILSGDLASAVDHYIRAISGVLMCGGTDQHDIIHEALSVAAASQSPNHIFRRHAAAAASLLNINSNYSLPTSTSTKITPQLWELIAYKRHFQRIFPSEAFFPGCAIDTPNTDDILRAPYDPQEWFKQKKPDIQSPNRKIASLIDVGEKAPQLIAQIYLGNWHNVQSLINAGAKVNALASNGESVLHAALWHLDCTNLLPPSRDRRFFDQLIAQPLSASTLNAQNHRTLVTPLMLAIESGNLDIVESLLNAGAEPNRHTKEDGQSPLITALNRLAMITRPRPLNTPETDELAYSKYIHSKGILGPPTSNKLEGSDDQLRTRFETTVQMKIAKHMSQYLRPPNLRMIISTLLDHGANPNASCVGGHYNNITPLMLAAEIDEANTFKQLIKAGGNIKSTTLCRKTGRVVSAVDFAKEFRSHNVIRVMADFGYIKFSTL